MISDFFPENYFDARARFREQATALDWSLESVALPTVGPSNEQLTVDIAFSSPATDGPLLFLTSGLHGVEGFVGSAIQLAMMDQWLDSPPDPDVRIVMVHALNPFGFVNCRRFDQANVDPNRNFLLEGQAYSGCSDAYRSLDRVLNPQRPPSRVDLFYLHAAWVCIRKSYRALAEAVVTGQYEFPRGLFFGGKAPTDSFQVLRESMPRWIGSSSPVIHLDYHSGLGKRGELKLLIDDRPPVETLDWLLRYYDRSHMSVYEHGESLYRARGSISEWSSKTFAANQLTFMCAEIGTYAGLRVLAGLRGENQAFHWSSNPHTLTNCQSRLKELFCPVSTRWREQAIEAGRHVTVCGLKALQEKLRN